VYVVVRPLWLPPSTRAIRSSALCPPFQLRVSFCPTPLPFSASRSPPPVTACSTSTRREWGPKILAVIVWPWTYRQGLWTARARLLDVSASPARMSSLWAKVSNTLWWSRQWSMKGIVDGLSWVCWFQVVYAVPWSIKPRSMCFWIPQRWSVSHSSVVWEISKPSHGCCLPVCMICSRFGFRMTPHWCRGCCVVVRRSNQTAVSFVFGTLSWYLAYFLR